MGRRQIPVTKDAIKRYLQAVRAAGVEIRSICVRPDGAVVINGDNGEMSGKAVDEDSRAEPFEEVDHL